jgi:hypothetical protein
LGRISGVTAISGVKGTTMAADPKRAGILSIVAALLTPS